jgi:hypothetical protein
MIIGGGGNDALSTTAVRFAGMLTQQVAAAEDDVQQVVTVAGTIDSLHIRLTTAPGLGRSYAFAARRNGVDTALSCTVSGSEQSCADTTSTAAFASGDLLSIRVTPIGTPVGADLSWTARLSP